MIKGNIKNIDQYDKVIDPEIIKAIKGLFSGKKECELKYSAFEYSYEHPDSEIVFESHKQNIDYQFIEKGNEYIYLADETYVVPLASYDKKDDYQLFHSEHFSKIIMNEGDFLVLMPGEIHSPKHQYQAQKVKRIVIKKRFIRSASKGE